MSGSKQTDGFTLTELLTVISIVAIMSAILLPVFSKAQERAKRCVCQSNMKQIALALSLYLHDYDSKFPIQPVDDNANGGGGVANWKVIKHMPHRQI